MPGSDPHDSCGVRHRPERPGRLAFTGQKSKRPSDPGPRQFITLLPNESVRQDVVLNHSYRFPSGTHTYTVTYSATHDYPGRFQNLTLTSAAAGVVAPQ